MGTGRLEPGARAGRALQQEMREADDEKINRIIAVVNAAWDPRINQVLLDPLRTRLASLKPARPLRPSRVLFTPLDPLIVPPSDWKPNEPSVPRSALSSILKVVQAGLGSQTHLIDTIIAGHQGDEVQTTTAAGKVLWPRAAEILAAVPPPVDWSETSLRPALYPPLVKAIATVLRRALPLRDLLLYGDVGAFATDDRAINQIFENIGREPADGCAMIARIILVQSPHAVPLWQRKISALSNAETRIMLMKATAGGVDQVLSTLDNGSALADGIGHAPLAGVADEVRRINSLLQQIEGEAAGKLHLHRLTAIRKKLGNLCFARFSHGMKEGLFTRLSATDAPMDPAGQTQLETCTRNLRSLETAARKVGGAANYDELLRQASDAVATAAKAGMLTPVRKLRLTEILSGSEAAETSYRAG